MKHWSATVVVPVTLSLSALLLGGSIVDAAPRAQSRAERIARKEIAKARTALDKQNIPTAIAHAETAVALEPATTEYRMTLGQSYLRAGRLTSARDAFADALSLDPTNGKAALHFALMQIGTGNWSGARATLAAYAGQIPVSDRALGLALAGDPVAAVDLLNRVVRTPDADAKTRQNFALSLALAGRWRDAQSVVEIDLAPVEAARRLLQWSTFARSTSASDQIAALLGVVPVVDAGQPQTLALNHDPATAIAAVGPASSVDVERREPRGALHSNAEQSVTVAVADAAPAVGPGIGGIVFAPRREVVQALPAVFESHRAPIRSSITEHGRHKTTKGNYYVQLGAFDTPLVAQDAWICAGRRFAALSAHVPQETVIATGGTDYYRLSIGGFAKDGAIALCRTYRLRGGDCFVRTGAGDRVAAWAKRRELVSR